MTASQATHIYRGSCRIFMTIILAGVMILGCNSTDPVYHVNAGEDKANAGEADTGDDVAPGDSNIGEPDVDEPDADEFNVDEPEEEVLVDTFAPSGGAHRLETANHHIRLIVAPRGGADKVSSTNHRILLGAGEAQHSQSR